MPTNWPTSIDSYTNPAPTDDVSVVSHSTQHSNHNDAIEAIETSLFDGLTDGGVVYSDGDKFIGASSVFRWNATDERLVIGDTTEAAGFFITPDTKMAVLREVVSTGSISPTFDIIKLVNETVLKLDPATDVSAGAFPVCIYGAQGFNLDVISANDIDGGLLVGSQGLGLLSALGAFGQVNIAGSGDVDGAAGFLFTATHQGGGSATAQLLGAGFDAGTDDSVVPGTPTGSVTLARGAAFTVGAGGAPVTTAIAGEFIEPRVYNAGNGYGLGSSITNKTAAYINGTYSLSEGTDSATGNIDAFNVVKSHYDMTGAAPNMRGLANGFDGKRVVFFFDNNATITHNQGAPVIAADRILTPTAANLTNVRAIELMWRSSSGAWEVLWYR